MNPYSELETTEHTEWHEMAGRNCMADRAKSYPACWHPFGESFRVFRVFRGSSTPVFGMKSRRAEILAGLAAPAVTAIIWLYLAFVILVPVLVLAVWQRCRQLIINRDGVNKFGSTRSNPC
jgi:hypothetical protein